MEEDEGPRSTFPAVDRFRIVRPLGAGAMGRVFEAEDVRSGARTAVKMLASAAPESVQRFKVEFRALRDLHHPNLVRLGELFESGGRWYFTMEVVDGVDFLQFVRPPSRAERGGTAFDEQRLRDATAQLAEGLLALHDAGKLHRDVKPSNIRVDRSGRVVLLDFGLVADIAPTSSSIDGGIVGTAMYMAPEQAAALPLGPAADWYAVGVMLYEALTGQLPFDGHLLEVLARKVEGDPAPPHDLVAALPDDLDQLCCRLLDRDPATRAGGRDVLHTLRRRPRLAAGTRDPPTMAAVFVGRARELDDLTRAFDGAMRGEVAAVVIEGESGVGKSALVRRFCTRLHENEADVVVLDGRCYERESVPYKGFDTVMDAMARHLRHLDQVDAALCLPRDAGLLSRLFPALHRVPAVRRAASATTSFFAGPDLRARAFAAVRSLFERLGERSRVVVWIDDVQWADADSIALLDELVHGDQPPRMLLLLTRRSDSSDGEVPLQALRNVGAIHRVWHLALTGLPPAESAELADELCRQYAATGAATAIAREARGHPFFLGELARYAAALGSTEDELRVEDALLYRLRQLDGEARAVLSIIAVAGAPVARHLVASAAGLLPAQVDVALGSLRVSMFVRGDMDDSVDCYHDRVRDAVYAALGEDRRRSLHARLALVLEDTEPERRDPHALVRHLLAAGETERAATSALAAAQLAVTSLAFDRAARLYRLALDLHPPSGPDGARLWAALGDALALAGDGAEAARAFLNAADAALAADALEWRRKAAQQFLRSGHVDAGLEAIRDVLRAIGMSLPTSDRDALRSTMWMRLRVRLRGLAMTVRDPTQISAEALHRVDTCHTVASTLGMVDNVRGLAFQGHHLLESLRCGEPTRAARAIAMEGLYRACGGHPRNRAQALQLARRSQELADGSGDYAARAVVITCNGLARYQLGEFRESLAMLEQAGDMFRERCSGVAWERDTLEMGAAWSLYYLGRFDELRRRIPGLIRDARSRDDRFAETVFSTGLTNLVWLVGSDAAAAREIADDGFARWSRSCSELHLYYHWLATSHIDLYTSALPISSRSGPWATLARSTIMRITSVRVEATDLRARMEIARARLSPGHRGAALRTTVGLARQLARENRAHARALAELLYAEVAHVEQEVELAEVRYNRAATALAGAGMELHAAVARLRRGALLGGDEGARVQALARIWMSEHGVREPDRMATLLAPVE